MRSFVIAIASMAAVSVLATGAFAGKIFGDITLGGKPVVAGIKIKVTRPGTAAVADTAVTDKFGSYKLLVKEEGKTTLTVLFEKQPLELAVFSNKEATRYDLVIEKKEGKLIVRRK
jgi:hypothetical protein